MVKVSSTICLWMFPHGYSDGAFVSNGKTTYPSFVSEKASLSMVSADNLNAMVNRLGHWGNVASSITLRPSDRSEQPKNAEFLLVTTA